MSIRKPSLELLIGEVARLVTLQKMLGIWVLTMMALLTMAGILAALFTAGPPHFRIYSMFSNTISMKKWHQSWARLMRYGHHESTHTIST